MIINLWLQVFSKSFTYLCIVLLIFIIVIVLRVYWRLPLKKRIQEVIGNYINWLTKAISIKAKLLRFRVVYLWPNWSTIKTWLLKHIQSIWLFCIIRSKQGCKFLENLKSTSIAWVYRILHFLSKPINQIVRIRKFVQKLTWPTIGNWCKTYIPKLGGAAINLTYQEKVHNTMLRELWLILFIGIFIYIYHRWFNEIPLVV